MVFKKNATSIVPSHNPSDYVIQFSANKKQLKKASCMRIQFGHGICNFRHHWASIVPVSSTTSSSGWPRSSRDEVSCVFSGLRIFSLSITTDQVRSTRGDNVFTPVCDSVGVGGGGVAVSFPPGQVGNRQIW